MIRTMMPFAPDMNLGRAYNEAMRLIGTDDWACFLDHDAIWTTREWYRQIVEATEFLPDAGLFTAVTNRIYQPWQRTGDPADHDNHDMVHHRRVGRDRLKVRTLLDVTDTRGIGGVVIVVSKRAWSDVGGFVDGMMCVDHQMHHAQRKTGRRVYVHEGLYVYHWRRAHGDGPPADAPVSKDCPCRQMRKLEEPRRRVVIP